MERDIILLLIGGLIGLFSSILTALINFAFERKRQSAQWQHEIEIKKIERRQKEIDDAHSLLEKSNLEKMSKIIVPEGRLACFPGFTLITMIDNTTRRIEEIKVGDELYSVDVFTKKSRKGMVTNIKMEDAETYVVINDLLHVTQSHGIFININENLESVPAGNLSLGNRLVNEGIYVTVSIDSHLLVTSLQLRSGPIKVYNLELDGNKPFFAAGILVGDLSSKVESMSDKLASKSLDVATLKRQELREKLLREKINTPQRVDYEDEDVKEAKRKERGEQGKALREKLLRGEEVIVEIVNENKRPT